MRQREVYENIQKQTHTHITWVMRIYVHNKLKLKKLSIQCRLEWQFR